MFELLRHQYTEYRLRKLGNKIEPYRPRRYLKSEIIQLLSSGDKYQEQDIEKIMYKYGIYNNRKFQRILKRMRRRGYIKATFDNNGAGVWQFFDIELGPAIHYQGSPLNQRNQGYIRAVIATATSVSAVVYILNWLASH